MDTKDGPLVLISEAAEMAEISTTTIRRYEGRGYLEDQWIEGAGVPMVYYRDVLRASWKAKLAMKENGYNAVKRLHGEASD